MSETKTLWRCPVCDYVMTEEQSKGYSGCPTGIHFAQHEPYESQALARCPFCGSAKVYVRFYNQPSVCCEDCLCMGPAAQHLTKGNKDECEREAILRWNKRVDYSHKITLE